MTIRFKKLHEKAILPSYQHTSDAGADLHAVEEVVVPAGEWRLVRTGLAVELPDRPVEGCGSSEGFSLWMEAQVRPRSGLALKKGVTALNSPGTIDAGYRDEIGVILVNHSKEDFFVKPGDRIAQLVFNLVVHPEKLVFSEEISETERKGGFGHTGVR
ncbi:MAG: dUTP diphosphatase [Calditrichaeota bacterium]|nr:dUTP diphosphatase [Calditrichota bacterium]